MSTEDIIRWREGMNFMFEWQENNISRMSAENELDIVLSPRT